MVTGFRSPWTAGARAYYEADTFEAAREGFKRKRKSIMFHMTNTGEAGDQTCIVCGALLRDAEDRTKTNVTGGTATPDRWSTWHYVPATKSIVGGMHYGCSWSVLLTAISKMRSF